MKLYSFKLPESMLEDVLAAAASLGQSSSEFIRDAIRHSLELPGSYEDQFSALNKLFLNLWLKEGRGPESDARVDFCDFIRFLRNNEISYSDVQRMTKEQMLYAVQFWFFKTDPGMALRKMRIGLATKNRSVSPQNFAAAAGIGEISPMKDDRRQKPAK